MKIARTVALVLLAASSAGAQSFNIDFGHSNPGPTAPPTSAFPGAAGQPGHWMNVPTALAVVQVEGLDGLFSGITLTRTAGNVSTFNVNHPSTTGEYEALLDDFHGFNSQTTVTYQFTGVDEGAYTLYTYAIAPDNSTFRTSVFVPGSSSVNPQAIGGAMLANGFSLGITHAAHDIVVGPDGVINLTLSGSGSAGTINGFQLRQGEANLTAFIQSPAAFSCGCSTINFIGSANGPGGIDGYTLEYSTSSGGPWIPFASGNDVVVEDELGSLNTLSLAEDDYLIRLTVTGLDARTTTGVTAIYVDRTAPIGAFTNITPSIVIGGNVAIQGSAHDRCFNNYTLQYALPSTGSFSPVFPGPSTSTTPVQNSLLGAWNTTTIADGIYELRVTSSNICGAQTASTQQVIIDNAPPNALIHQPSGLFDLCGFVSISATVNDANLDHWTIEYTNSATSGWTQIASGANTVSGVVASWDTTGLPRGPYTLRLTAVDRATDLTPGGLDGRTTTFLRTVNIGRGSDINNDGVVNSADLSVFLANFGATCF